MVVVAGKLPASPGNLARQVFCILSGEMSDQLMQARLRLGERFG
jgi:hypothetical protein